MIDSSALQVAVSEVNPGTALNLGVIRNGQPTTVHITVGEYHPAGQQMAANDGDGAPQSGNLGLAVADLTANERQQMNIPDDVHGAVVENVRPGSPAEDALLQPGDVILQVNRKPTDSASQFVNQVHGAGNNQDLLLLVWSKGNASYRTLRPEADGQNG